MPASSIITGLMRSGASIPVRGVVARWPAALAAAGLIAGVWAHRVLPVRPGWWVGLLASAIVAGIILHRRPRAATALLLLGLFTAGLLAGQLATYHYPTNHISAYAAEESRLAQIEMRIDDPPRVLTNPFDARRSMPPKQVATARVMRVKTWGGWVECGGEVLVQIAQPHPTLGAGQTVRVIGMLQRPSRAMNPGQFDWADYYREQRILASITIPQAGNIHIIADDGPGPIAAAREKARRWLAAGFGPERALDHALLRALLLGDRDPQLRDVQEQFQQTGTSHHLAISGLHIAVLGGFLFGICRLLCVPPRTSAIIVMLFVIVYGTLALPSPPVVRSVLLCLAVSLGLISRRSVDMVQLLAVSVMLMLIYHPPDLYTAGFQLSFGVVLALMVFTTPMLRFFEGFGDPDMKLARRFERASRLGTLRDWVSRLLLTSLAAGLVAWWVSMPLIAFHFEQLNPWAVFGSILLAPVVFAALVCGLLKVVFTALWPSLAGTWAAWMTAPITWMRGTVDWLATFPSSSVPVPPPPIWLMVLFYVLLLMLLLPRMRPGFKWVLRIAVLIMPLFWLFFPLQRAMGELTSGGECRVTLLAVGAGQCAVIEPPSGRTVLVDAGSASLSDMLTKCLGPYLRHSRRTEVDTVVISHANLDHYSAVAELAEGYGVREVWTSADFARHSDGIPQAGQMLATLNRIERPPRLVATGANAPLGRDTTIEVLWPPPDAPANLSANDTSLVIRLTHAGRIILFTGDVQDAALRELLKLPPEKLKADVLIAPHHGSGESQTEAFVRAVDPAYILSSNDRTLSGKQQAFERMIGDRALYRTHRCGSITVVITREGELRVEPFWDVPATRGR